MKKIDKAIKYAMEKHQGQYRKDSGIPYITHPLEVMKLISNWGFVDEDILCAAILHDVIEDCGVTKEDIAFEFGLEVAMMVQECTRKEEDGKDTKGKWSFMMSFYEKSEESVIIKLADRICNVKDYIISEKNVYASWYSLQAHSLMERYTLMNFSQKENMSIDMYFLQSIAYQFFEELLPYVYGKTLDNMEFTQELLEKVKYICINGKPDV